MGPNSTTKGKGKGNKVEREMDQSEVDTLFLVKTSVVAESEDSQPCVTGQRTKCTNTFCSSDEQVLVDFFREHPELYDHGNDMYHNKPIKDKWLGRVAMELNTTTQKIEAWFKNQRTAVGKIFKHKAGQAEEDLTVRQRWQKTNFSFLRGHIHPRSYTPDLGKIQSSQQSASSHGEEESESDDWEETASSSKQPWQYISTSQSVSQQPSGCTQSQSLCGQDRQGRKRSHELDQALIEYLRDQTPPQEQSKKIKAALEPPKDDRTAWGQWMMARMAKIPDDQWQQFQDESYLLIARFTQDKPRTKEPQQAYQIVKVPLDG